MGGGVDRAGFALIAHTDTVAEGDLALWTQPPFAAEIVAGRMVGRGTADNKAGIAIGLYTLALLRDRKLIDPTMASPYFSRNRGVKGILETVYPTKLVV